MIATFSKYSTQAADLDRATKPLVQADAVPDASVIWGECLEIIKGSVTHQAFKTWFEPTKAIRLEGATLTVQVPSRFFYEWIEEHY